SGYIKDAATGETLISANVYNKSDLNEGAVSNAYGFYSLTLDEGTYTITFSYLGFQDQNFEINLTQDMTLNVDMSEGLLFDEIVVEATKDDSRKNVESTQLGAIELPMENIKKLPAIFSDVDILKTLQLLPGVLSSGEGTSGFYVRGGGPDQNLLLLDEAVVYNS